MRHLLFESLSPSTRAAYNSGTNAFVNFCLQHHRFTQYQSILPATEETLMLFASYLSLKVSPPTIKVYLAAVRNLHLEAGYADEFDRFRLLPRLVRGIRRTLSQDRRPRLPITPQILLSFRKNLNMGWQDHRVLWSAMVVAFFAFLRSSELLALRKEDASILDSLHTIPTFGLRIRSSKTDPFRHSVTVRVAPSGNADLCPAQALLELTNQSYATHPTSPLLQWSDGSAITRQSLNNAIKWLARSVHLNDSHFSTHSFRIGAATAASAAGIPDYLIKTMGRWSSDAYQLYIRTPDSTLDAVSRSLANIE